MSEVNTSGPLNVLMPAFTVADWGGLHENVLFAAKACLGVGHAVTVVTRPGQFAEALRASGADVVEVDWDRWQEFLPAVLANGPYDLVFTQPFTSRRLALEVSRLTGTPVLAMFHGFNHDYVYMWQDRVASIAVTADVLREFLVDFCRVPAEKIMVIPNGIPTERFHHDVRSRKDRLADGELRILLASRLTPDKRSQIDVLRRVIGPVAENHSDLRVVVDVLGGGPEELRIRSVLAGLEATHPNVEGRMHGWVDAAVIPEFLDRSYLSITAGRAGLQSMVAGTPTIAAGARGIVGPAWGENLGMAVDSNFGDYPIRGKSEWVPQQVIEALTGEEVYANVQAQSRTALADRAQCVVDEKILQALSAATDSNAERAAS